MQPSMRIEGLNGFMDVMFDHPEPGMVYFELHVKPDPSRPEERTLEIPTPKFEELVLRGLDWASGTD